MPSTEVSVTLCMEGALDITGVKADYHTKTELLYGVWAQFMTPHEWFPIWGGNGTCKPYELFCTSPSTAVVLGHLLYSPVPLLAAVTEN